jgi:hypothetical protein
MLCRRFSDMVLGIGGCFATVSFFSNCVAVAVLFVALVDALPGRVVRGLTMLQHPCFGVVIFIQAFHLG